METKSKTHVCEIDNRRFHTRAALRQHIVASHPAPPAFQSQSRRGRGGTRAQRARPNRRFSNRRVTGINVAPSNSMPAPGGGIVVSGEDRLGTFQAQTNSAVFQRFSISPGASLRLKAIAHAFQRVRWLSVEVRVIPQASLTVSGGYVCGFIMDPEDGSVTANMLTATQGAITKKWYETAIVRMPRKPDLLYTSVGSDPRLQIPAVFWVISNGLPTTATDVVVTMTWRVALSEPTVESENSLSVMSPAGIWPIKSNYNLSWKDKRGVFQVDFSSWMPSAINDSSSDYHYFRVPTFNIEYAEGAGDTGTVQAHFVAYRKEDHKMYYSSDGSNIATTVWQSTVDATQCLVPCNTMLRYDGTGNLCGGRSRLSPSLGSISSQSTSKTLEMHIESLNQRLKMLEVELNERPSSSKISRSSSVRSLDSWKKI